MARDTYVTNTGRGKGCAAAVADELQRRRTNKLEEHADAPEGLTQHPSEMTDDVLEARLHDLYVEALDRDIQAGDVVEEEEG